MRREEKNAVGRHTSCQVAIHRFVRVWFEECARPLLTTSSAITRSVLDRANAR